MFFLVYAIFYTTNSEVGGVFSILKLLKKDKLFDIIFLNRQKIYKRDVNENK